MRELGRQHGYIVVQPNSNPGPPTGGWYPDDNPSVWAFMERTASVFHVDPKRWHFMGFSQGGHMTWNMLCDHSDKLASIAPAAYGMDLTDRCSSAGGDKPQYEIPTLYVHGTKDAVRPFAEAETQRDNIIDDWGLTQDSIVSQDALHTWTRYRNANGAIFEFFQHDYAADSDLYKGHCIPGGLKSGGLLGFACLEAGTPNWPAQVIQFFMDHPKP
jgi:poly(3-hydroxybutyrate) depolymerase